jgi:hypothetical protein
MSERRELLTREKLMDMLETQWGRYIPTLEALTEEDQQRYARQEGYASLKDLLAHITAWMQKSLEVVPMVARGEPYNPEWEDDDDFNARAVELARDQTLDQAKEDFENTRTALAGMIAELPADVINHPNVYNWLHGSIILHYQEHEPPGDPQVPAEQHVVTD